MRGRVPGGSAAEQRTCLKAALTPAQRREKFANEKAAREREQYIARLETALRDQGDRKRIEDRVHEQALGSQAEAAAHAEREARRRRTAADATAASAAAEAAEAIRLASEQAAKLKELVAKQKQVSNLEAANAKLEKKYAACLESKEELKARRVSVETAYKQLVKENVSLQSAVADESEAKAALEERVELECAEVARLQQWKDDHRPARGGGPQPKPIDELDRRQRDRRRVNARARLVEALNDADLRGEDVATALESAEKVDVIFETKELWARKMAFAQDLCDTIGSVWNADLSVDMRDEYALSERIMDGLRFDLSHEVINGRPRPRVLVTNPHTKARLNFPQPVKARCAWTQRSRERDEARQWIEREGAETTERDFDATLDELVARDESLLRDGFSAARPFAFSLGFDGADNFTHVTLRITDYKAGVAAESELKAKQLAVGMGNDHYPRLEKMLALIGPAASARTSVTIGGEAVPAVATMCLDLSAARSAYGRRSGKSVYDQRTDVHTMPTIPARAKAAEAFAIVDRFSKWNTVDALREDAHSPSSFPFKCKRSGCTAPLLRDAAHRQQLKAELAALAANKTVAGKREYAKAIAVHCDAHGQQMPYQDPVTSIPLPHLISDLLHMLDLNLPKTGMKYSLFDPAILTDDMRLQIGDFLSEIGCSLDIREKGNRDNSKKWFHGSVWHYDFVLGANRKSFGLHANIFQLCLIVYGVQGGAQMGSQPAAAGVPATPAGGKRKQPPAIVNDFSDDEFADDDDDDEADADLESDEVMSELRAFFGANAEKVKTVLELWNAYAALYNALCDEWTSDCDAYRQERGFRTLKAGLAYWAKLNDISKRRHKSDYPGIAALVASRQQAMWGDLWRFSTRSVEGRGGQLKKIGRRMICWRRRSKAKYRRTIRGKGGAARVVEQGYTSAPERQLMRALCNREDRSHTQKRSRVAATGRNTLARAFVREDDPRIALREAESLEGSDSEVKRLCTAARSHMLGAPEWRLKSA